MYDEKQNPNGTELVFGYNLLIVLPSSTHSSVGSCFGDLERLISDPLDY